VQVVAQSDVVFVASGSETLLIHGSDLEGMPAAKPAVGGVRRFFDISVPRNVATDVSDVPNSRVFNVDDLKEVPFLPLPPRLSEEVPFALYSFDLKEVPFLPLPPRLSEEVPFALYSPIIPQSSLILSLASSRWSLVDPSGTTPPPAPPPPGA